MTINNDPFGGRRGLDDDRTAKREGRQSEHTGDYQDIRTALNWTSDRSISSGIPKGAPKHARQGFCRQQATIEGRKPRCFRCGLKGQVRAKCGPQKCQQDRKEKDEPLNPNPNNHKHITNPLHTPMQTKTPTGSQERRQDPTQKSPRPKRITGPFDVGRM